MSDIIISLDKVKKVYFLDTVEVDALKDISLDINAGDFVSIAGPSGSGKTTILNLIGCVDKPTSGAVIVHGKRTSDLNDDSLTELRHRSIGFIFQTFNLIPVLNIRENVELPLLLDSQTGNEHKADRKEWVDYLIESVGLKERMLHKPAELSGGQRQRVAIARALVMKPAIVLADEPTANLDSATGESILRLMRHMNETFGTTFIFSTHDPDIVEEADHIIRLRDGRIVEDRRIHGKTSVGFAAATGADEVVGATGTEGRQL
jgi:putative ABC transport system ATP-binding protein